MKKVDRITMDALREMLLDCPVAAAIKNAEGLARAIAGPSRAVIVLYGDINGIAGVVDRVKAAGKAALVHLDLVDGLAPREAAVDFLAGNTRADGVVSTKPAVLKAAKHRGLISVQRFFILDSMSLDNLYRQINGGHFDMIEVLPGVMPKVIRRVASAAGCPVMASGLISDKEDVMAALGAGAVAVSATSSDIWNM